MNYRHAYHAGNFADVLKHTVMALVIEHLKRKPAPFRVIDTHAGAGHYSLHGGEATRTGEWREGIARLIGPEAAPLPAEIATLLGPYLGAIQSMPDHRGESGDIVTYPGSPALALSLLRPEDRLVAVELHPQDFLTLKASIGADRRAKALELDGWTALKSLLPPKERRGLVLIDPPFEIAGETERLVTGMVAALARFATGTYILWFPVKGRATIDQLSRALTRLAGERMLWIELATRTIDDAGLAACGLAVINPPFTLEPGLRQLLPFLAERLGTGPGAAWTLQRPGIGAPAPRSATRSR